MGSPSSPRDPSVDVVYVVPDGTDPERRSESLAFEMGRNGETGPDADTRPDVDTGPDADTGVEIDVVDGVEACLERVADGRVDCVVVEWAPDGGNGLDAVRAVGELDATLPVLLATPDGDRPVSDALDAVVAVDRVSTASAESPDRLERPIREAVDRAREREQYRTLVDTVGDPMYVLDADGYVEMANEAMVTELRMDCDEVTGAHVSTFMPEEDVERGVRTLLDVAADESRTWGRFEMTVLRGDGTTYDAEDSVAPLVDADGTLTGSVGVVRDISERKARERRIRRLHEGTRRLMAATGTDDVARTACEVARDALDLPTNSVYLYDPDVDGLVPAAASEQARELLGEPPVIEREGGLIWDAYAAGEPMAHGDVTRYDGVRNPETPIRSEAHVPLGDHGVFVVGSTEVNDFEEEALALAKILSSNLQAALDRAERESELAERTGELERQNDRLEAFAGTLSHDLRNPLTLANGHLEAAAELVQAADELVASDGEPGDGTADETGDETTAGGVAADAVPVDDVSDHLAEVDWALDRMEDLIDDVLLLARSGRRLTETSTVALDEVVERARLTVDEELDVVVEDPLPTVEGDESRLLACFENLFRNAREHGGADVTVTVAAAEDGFTVADDGPGIPPADRSSVLEYGYTTDEEGTGFGLAIVSEVVEAHGWSIDVGESAAGGTRIDVSFDADGPRGRSSVE